MKEHKFTEREAKYLAANFEDFPYIARDKDGRLYAFSEEPRKYSHFWQVYQDGAMGRTMKNVQNHFQTIQWEDEEPCRWEEWT